jgi:hypothetical protein
METTPGYSIISNYFNSLRPKSAKYRSKLSLGGFALLLLLLVPGSSAFAQATFNTATLVFGDHVVNVSSPVKKAWLTNTQTVPLAISSIAISGGNAPGDFVLDAGGTCALSPETLEAGKYCSIPVTFTPSELGSRTATLTVTDDAGNSPQTVALTGTGTEPVDLTPSALAFGKQPEGTTGAAKTATLKNLQTATLTNISISFSGDYARKGGTCAASGGTLAGGASCTIVMAFTPSILGSDPGTLTVADSASNSPQTVALTGKGASPVTVSPASLTFVRAIVGTTRAARTVKLTNRLTTSLTVSTPVATGDFAAASNTCGANVGPGLTCTLGVTFTPTEVGPRTGSLTIPYSAFGSSSVVALSGTGNPGPISISLTPENPGIFPGQTVQFTATGHFSSGKPENLAAWVTWSSSAPGVATINAAGLASIVGEGQTTIKAALGAINGSTTLSALSFVHTGSMTNARASHTATLLNNDLVLMAGGSFPPIASAELYNPATGTFTPTGSMNTGRAWHTATLLNNGMVLMAGGRDASTYPTASAELYNPATGTFTLTGSMSTARTWGTATLLNNGMVLMAGGSFPPIVSAELYNPATGTFTPTGSMNAARAWQTATLLNNGMVLMAGGWDASGNPIARAELYNPATGTFTLTGSMSTARTWGTATLLDNGMVLIAGGAASWTSGSIASAELYNPATGTFTYTTGKMNSARSAHTATLLSSGVALVAGGWNGIPGEASAELYNPATETFSYTIGSMNTARYWHTATLLNDGTVLMAGGRASGPEFLASAELYGPVTLTPPNLESIAITPATSTLSPGTTQQFIATGTFSDGSTQQLASVTWSTSNPAVAQITNDWSNHGVALAIAAGTVTITATDGSVSGTATLTVQ